MELQNCNLDPGHLVVVKHNHHLQSSCFSRNSAQKEIFFWWAEKLIRKRDWEHLHGYQTPLEGESLKSGVEQGCYSGPPAYQPALYLQWQCEFPIKYQVEYFQVQDVAYAGRDMLVFTSTWNAVVLNLISITWRNTRQPWEWLTFTHNIIHESTIGHSAWK